jgi:putative SOS response-associated peptidase YedK
MSRLHTVQASIEDVARHFRAEVPDGLTIPRDTIEGCPGVVVVRREGRRYLRNYSWGFPRPDRERIERGDPPEPLGLVANSTNPMWEKVIPDPRYRCLIVLTHFANPDGIPGGKTRTWFSVKGQPIVAWAGICRNTLEFGPVYAGLTREENGAIQPTNDRMPVILMPHEYDDWLSGSVEDLIRFQFGPAIAQDRIVVDRTEDLWRSDGLPSTLDRQMPLL